MEAGRPLGGGERGAAAAPSSAAAPGIIASGGRVFQRRARRFRGAAPSALPPSFMSLRRRPSASSRAPGAALGPSALTASATASPAVVGCVTITDSRKEASSTLAAHVGRAIAPGLSYFTAGRSGKTGSGAASRVNDSLSCLPTRDSPERRVARPLLSCVRAWPMGVTRRELY
ncbi:MAG: hypothetical protein J3K34DRAFT_418942 [Monoraphidium minutum]|nr:MAG: hypothetical protein J3K34DRAFT_418942 [Monoraphidium minutum]